MVQHREDINCPADMTHSVHPVADTANREVQDKAVRDNTELDIRTEPPCSGPSAGKQALAHSGPSADSPASDTVASDKDSQAASVEQQPEPVREVVEAAEVVGAEAAQVLVQPVS